MLSKCRTTRSLVNIVFNLSNSTWCSGSQRKGRPFSVSCRRDTGQFGGLIIERNLKVSVSGIEFGKAGCRSRNRLQNIQDRWKRVHWADDVGIGSIWYSLSLDEHTCRRFLAQRKLENTTPWVRCKVISHQNRYVLKSPRLLTLGNEGYT